MLEEQLGIKLLRPIRIVINVDIGLKKSGNGVDVVKGLSP